MGTLFLGKNIKHRVVRPMKNSAKNRGFYVDEKKGGTIETVKETVDEVVSEEKTKKENKKTKKSKDMVDESKLQKVESVVGTDIPSMNVKIEKSEKGLYERTENSTILLTEDNKMLLND